MSLTHTYISPKPFPGYSVTLTVSDGLLSRTDTVNIIVNGDPITKLSDNFNRDDSDTLGGPSPSGLQWAEAQGALVISGHQLKNTLRGRNVAILPDLVGIDQSAEADFTSVSNSASPGLGVILRFQDVNNHYRLYRSAGGTTALNISRVVNGTEKILKQLRVPQPVVGTPFHLKGSLAGNVLTLKLTEGAQTQTLTIPDSTFASGSPGVLLYTGPAASHAADNFCAAIGAGTCP